MRTLNRAVTDVGHAPGQRSIATEHLEDAVTLSLRSTKRTRHTASNNQMGKRGTNMDRQGGNHRPLTVGCQLEERKVEGKSKREQRVRSDRADNRRGPAHLLGRGSQVPHWSTAK